jgi:hypothetical protein
VALTTTKLNHGDHEDSFRGVVAGERGTLNCLILLTLQKIAHRLAPQNAGLVGIHRIFQNLLDSVNSCRYC